MVRIIDSIGRFVSEWLYAMLCGICIALEIVAIIVYWGHK